MRVPMTPGAPKERRFNGLGVAGRTILCHQCNAEEWGDQKGLLAVGEMRLQTRGEGHGPEGALIRH